MVLEADKKAMKMRIHMQVFQIAEDQINLDNKY